MIAFFESDNFEDAIRKSISLGGDSDTQACIAGGIAQAFYRHIPVSIQKYVCRILPKQFLAIVEQFNRRYGVIY